MKADSATSLSVNDGASDLIVLDTKNSSLDFNLNTMDISSQPTRVQMKASASTSLKLSHGSSDVIGGGHDGNTFDHTLVRRGTNHRRIGCRRSNHHTETLTTTDVVTLEQDQSRIVHSGTTSLNIESTSGKIEMKSTHSDANAIQMNGKISLVNLGGQGDSLRIGSSGSVVRDRRLQNLIALTGAANEYDTHLGTFNGGANNKFAFNSNQTTRALLQALETRLDVEAHAIDNLATLTGRDQDATHMGTFGGYTIADNRDIRGAFADVEAAIEANDADINDVQLTIGIGDNVDDMGAFGNNSSLEQIHQRGTSSGGRKHSKCHKVQSDSNRHGSTYKSPTAVISTSNNFSLAAKEAQGGSRPGIVFGLNGDAADQSVGKFVNPHMHYFTGDASSLVPGAA